MECHVLSALFCYAEKRSDLGGCVKIHVLRLAGLWAARGVSGPDVIAAIDAGGLSANKPIRQIWEVVSGKLPARRDQLEKIVVATVGLTTQDTAIAHALYLQAKDEDRGLRLPF